MVLSHSSQDLSKILSSMNKNFEFKIDEWNSKTCRSIQQPFKFNHSLLFLCAFESNEYSFGNSCVLNVCCPWAFIRNFEQYNKNVNTSAA